MLRPHAQPAARTTALRRRQQEVRQPRHQRHDDDDHDDGDDNDDDDGDNGDDLSSTLGPRSIYRDISGINT